MASRSKCALLLTALGYELVTAQTRSVVPSQLTLLVLGDETKEGQVSVVLER